MNADPHSHDEEIEGTTAAGQKRRRSPLQPERPSTEYALLGLLMDGPSHGYDLTRQFSASSELGKVCRLEMSMLYGVLKKLEREELILSREEAVSGNKSRRIVELTERGRHEFEGWLVHPVRHTREIRLDFMVKLYFARLRDPALALRLLEEQLQFNQNLLTQLTSQATAVADLPPTHFERWLLEFRLQQNQAVLNWLNHCRSQLRLSE